MVPEYSSALVPVRCPANYLLFRCVLAFGLGGAQHHPSLVRLTVPGALRVPSGYSNLHVSPNNIPPVKHNNHVENYENTMYPVTQNACTVK